MKIIVLFLVAITSLLSCSSDDGNEQNQVNQDPIIGTWNFDKNNTVDVSDCLKQTTYVFNADGTYTYTQYNLDNSNNCVENTNQSFYGTWQKNDDGTYYRHKHGYTSGTNLSITFENNNSTMIIENRYSYVKN